MLGVTPEQNIKVEEIRGKSSDETASYCAEKLFQLYDDKIKDFREEFKRFEKEYRSSKHG